MLLHTLTFSGDVNISLQPGDIIYYSPTSTVPGSNISSVNDTTNIVLFGVCVSVFNNGSTTVSPTIPPFSILVSYDNNAVPAINIPQNGDYIMFSKNKEVNSSSLKGYYAEVTFSNDSPGKVELFSVGAGVSESSK